MSSQLQVIDSHTGGEPTRTVVSGLPDLGVGSVAERLERFKTEHDWVRSAVNNEPRGSDAMVGAALVESSEDDCDLGVIYFNNVGYLKMCVHGTIGVAVTLAYQGKLDVGSSVRLETCVGKVEAELVAANQVRVSSVLSYRSAAGVEIEVEGYGRVRGDVSWGGNWFFLIEAAPLEVAYSNLAALTDFCAKARVALERAGITGSDGGEIDHIEVFAPASDGLEADSRNFVYCPGGAYDRSPCGTGTSAKLACLHAAGKLRAGEVWRQASILGSVFEGRVSEVDGGVIPEVTGTAYVNGLIDLVINPDDPFRFGITPATVS
ncbi:MAG: 4-hydroxyproline epimerase [Verrucomicrobiales bacterium]|jgi:4-hydroxyproline epimerase